MKEVKLWTFSTFVTVFETFGWPFFPLFLSLFFFFDCGSLRFGDAEQISDSEPARVKSKPTAISHCAI